MRALHHHTVALSSARATSISYGFHLASERELTRATELVEQLERATDAEFDAHQGAETSPVQTWSTDYPRLFALTMVQGAVFGWLFVAREFGSVRRSLDELLAAERAKHPLVFGEGGVA